MTSTDDAGFLIPREAPAIAGMDLLPPQVFSLSDELSASIARLRLGIQSRSTTPSVMGRSGFEPLTSAL